MTDSMPLQSRIDGLEARLSAAMQIRAGLERHLAAAAEREQQLQAEVAGWESDLEKEAANARVAWERIAVALGYCKKHAHPGVNMAAHTYLDRVIAILEGRP